MEGVRNSGDGWTDRRRGGSDNRWRMGAIQLSIKGAERKDMSFCPTFTPGHLPGSRGRSAGLHMPLWLWG